MALALGGIAALFLVIGLRSEGGQVLLTEVGAGGSPVIAAVIAGLVAALGVWIGAWAWRGRPSAGWALAGAAAGLVGAVPVALVTIVIAVGLSSAVS